MADEIDIATERANFFHEANISAIREKAATIPKGIAGECRLCGEESKRLIGGACAPCRDKFNLP